MKQRSTLLVTCVLFSLLGLAAYAVVSAQGDRQRDDDPPRRSESQRRDRERAERASPEARRDADRPQRDPEVVSDFQPQSEGEAVLLRMIRQLQREVAQLRREVAQLRGERPGEGERPRDRDQRREGDRPRDRDQPREGDRPRDRDRPREGDRPRDRDRPRTTGRPSSDQAEAFQRYDTNRDQTINLEEFLALREGTDQPQVRARWQRFFVNADGNRDGVWSLQEFLAAVQRRGAEGDRQQPRDKPRADDRPATDAPPDRERSEVDDQPDRDRPPT